MVDLDTTFEEYEDVRHSDVVRDVFTLRQEVSRLAAESLEVLRLVRDTTLAPDDRLAAIEELLTDDPEDPDDAY